MTEVRVGDVRFSTLLNKTFAVTNIHDFHDDDDYWCEVADIVISDGSVDVNVETYIIDDYKLLAHYDTWQEAIASKEFKGE